MRFYLSLFALFLFFSCTISKVEYSMMDELEACYAPSFKEGLDKLLSEMDKHIVRNGHQDFPSYLIYLKKGGLADIQNYGESEKELGTHFIETSFKKLFCDYSYVEGGRNGKVLTYEDYKANPKKVAIRKDLSHDKTFLKCLHTIRDRNSFVNEFLELDMGKTSPNEFTRWIFNYQDLPGYNEEIAKQIIALEMYLLVLELVGDKDNCANKDCP